jgi:hypothetical protein
MHGAEKITRDSTKNNLMNLVAESESEEEGEGKDSEVVFRLIQQRSYLDLGL